MKKEKSKKKKGFLKWLLMIVGGVLALALLGGLASVGLESLAPPLRPHLDRLYAFSGAYDYQRSICRRFRNYPHTAELLVC